jgi:hypothetical protein
MTEKIIIRQLLSDNNFIRKRGRRERSDVPTEFITKIFYHFSGEPAWSAIFLLTHQIRYGCWNFSRGSSSNSAASDAK